MTDAERSPDRAREPPFLRRLLVAVDASVRDDATISFAIALAHRYGSTLAFAYAVDRTAALAEACIGYGNAATVRSLERAFRITARSALRGASLRAERASVIATTAILEGDPPTSLADFENRHPFDALIVGARIGPEMQTFFLGDTETGILRTTEVPVFVVPSDLRSHGPLRSLLVAVDPSAASRAAIDFAFRYAAGGDVRLSLYTVARDPADVERAAALFVEPRERAATTGIPIATSIGRGDAATEILAAASRDAADAIVLGTHGRCGMRNWIFGSVAEAVVRRSAVPVVIVRDRSGRVRHRDRADRRA